MAEVKNQLEIKFRLSDGSDIGPKSFSDATTIATLKETIVSQWPRDKQNGPITSKEVKLISGGRILENNKTVGDCCRSPVCNLSGAVTTMHVLIQPPITDKEKKKKPKAELNQNKCVCSIM